MKSLPRIGVSVFVSSLMTAASASTVIVQIKGLRTQNGYIGASLFAEKNQKDFPSSPGSARATYYAAIDPAGSEGTATFALKDIPAGRYALAVIHDEDGDHKVKMFLGIPREGFGFSNNPTIFFGPPNFDKAAVNVDAEDLKLDVTMKYIL